MKKRTISLVAVVTAVLLLTFVVFAGTPDNLGYETFKEVLKGSDEGGFDKGNLSIDLEIIDNNKTVVNVKGIVNGNHDSEEMSGEFKIITETLEKEITVYGSEDLFYIHDVNTDDVYVGTHTEEEYCRDYDHEYTHEGSKKFSEKSEAIMDYFVGDIAKEFRMIEDTDGTMDLEFELNKSEIPAILNLLVSLKAESKKGFDEDCKWENKSDLASYPLFKEFCDADIELTELVDYVELDYLKVVLDLDAGKEVQGIAFKVSVSGFDENSEEHVITIEAAIKMLDGENAQIKKIDLGRKNVINVEDF